MQSLSQLVAAMRSHGVVRLLAKRLAPNDNSKNQIYLGGDFSALSVLPHGNVEIDASQKGDSVRDRAKAAVQFYWIDGQHLSPAPAAQLILYPRFPEVRLSGLLKGSAAAPSSVLTVRDEGRLLILGVTPDGRIIGFAASADHPVTRDIASIADPERLGIFLVVPMAGAAAGDTRHQLISELGRVHAKGWIGSQKLGADGKAAPYVARNAGGLTLEAELGIRPNGRAEPDYLGWEVKQFGVNNLSSMRALSAVTLMTPEPTAGLYGTEGAEAFVRRFGYADRSGKEDRLNFGGDYRPGKLPNPLTGLSLAVRGYDRAEGKITDMGGDIALVSSDGFLAAAWPFTALMAHWTHKHARAAYVPSISRAEPAAYAFGRLVQLYEQTDFLLFLAALSEGLIRYDPALKIEASSSPQRRIKKRNQFRTKQSDLRSLYQHGHQVDVLTSAAKPI
jgi:hypothetical protein